MHHNLENFCVFRGKARRTIRDSKRKSWKQYVSKLNSRRSIKKVCDMVRKIQGKKKSASVNHLKKNYTHVTSKKDIANTLADNFSKKSSENYSAKFRNIKDQREKQKLKFTSDNTESYNSKFSLKELTDALSKAHDSSSGPDDIHYQLLKHLPSSSLSILLEIYTCVPAPKCGRRPHFGAVGIAGLYIGRLRNCLPFLTSFTQCRMANLHIKCFDINAYQRLECYRALR